MGRTEAEIADSLAAMTGSLSALLCPSEPIQGAGQYHDGTREGQAPAQAAERKILFGTHWTQTNYAFNAADKLGYNVTQFLDQDNPGVASKDALPTINGPNNQSLRTPFERVNGDFNLGSARSFSEVSDGLSNSLFLAERGIMDISQRERVQGGFADGGANTPGDTTVGTGGGNGGWVHRFRIDDAMAMANGTKYVPNVSLSSGTLLNSGKYISWRVANSAFDSQAGGNRFHTILKPNGPSVQPLDSDDTPNAVRIYAANSYHTAGVNTVFGDGSVHFVSDTINTMSAEWNGAAFTGDTIVTFHDSYFSGASPFGVWGALGAINDGQAVSIP